jgi:hypothetical protein
VSLTLTLAKAEAQAAEEKWADHVHNCPPCSRWRKRQKGQLPCARGLALFEDYEVTRHRHEREKELDRRPWPGQESLFPELPAPVLTSSRRPRKEHA